MFVEPFFKRLCGLSFSFCVRQHSKASTTPQRFSLELSVGTKSSMAEQHKPPTEVDLLGLDYVEDQVVNLDERLQRIMNEADYMKEKEVLFHQSSESINYTALWWPMGQIAILLVAGIYQAKHLKNFFIKSKLY
jgi:hypothetical protein